MRKKLTLLVMVLMLFSAVTLVTFSLAAAGDDPGQAGDAENTVSETVYQGPAGDSEADEPEAALPEKDELEEDEPVPALMQEESVSENVYSIEVFGVKPNPGLGDRIPGPGDKIDVTYSIRNNPGIVSFGMDLLYDQTYLTPVSVTKNSEMMEDEEGLFSSNLAYAPGVIKVGYAGSENFTGDDVLFTVKYQVSADAPDNLVTDLKVSVDELTALNDASDTVALPCTVVDGSVTVWKVTLGDVDGDKEITPVDATYGLLYYTGLNKELTIKQQYAADANRDGQVYPADATEILLHWAGIKTIGDLPASIRVTALPAKTTYFVGEEQDLRGLVVTGTYSDGSEQVLAIAPEQVTGFDSGAPAENQVLTITYWGRTATFTVTIKAPVSAVSIANQFTYPTGAEYCSLTADTLRSFDDSRGKGYMFGDTKKTVLNAYVIFVDFPDCVGAEPATYGDLQNVFSSSADRTGGYVYDYSKPETFVNNLFYGSQNLPDYHGTPYEGLVDYFKRISYGKMGIRPIIVNAMVPNGDGSIPWFRLPKAQKEYAIQFASGVEDYRALGRLHQAAIDIAYENVPGLNLSDIDFLYTIPPINTKGSRSGLAGGDGIDTAFSFQDQWLLLEGTEYEHEPSVKTHEGVIIGSAVSVSKNTRGYGGDSYMYRVIAHETSHGLGLIDNYLYDGKDHHAEGWTQSSRVTGPWGIMGSSMTSATGDWFAWDKFKAGWFDDDQVETVLPGTEKTVRLSALGSNEGDYAGVKMVLLPTELRTIDTFHTSRNRNGTNFDFLDYFIPVWLGGEENAEKTFPTGYVLECRRAVGVDENNTANTPGNKGVLITQLSNLTWETGHGGAGFKVMRVPPTAANPNTSCIAASGSGYSSQNSWEDKARGIRIEVVDSTPFYDDVKITYTGQGKDGSNGDVKRPYQGNLQLDNNDVAENEDFTVNFHLKTRGVDATDGRPNPAVVGEGSPLAVPMGVAGYTLVVTYDPAKVTYVDGVSPFRDCTIADDGAGEIAVSADDNEMRGGNILSLQFKSLNDTGLTKINAEFQDAGLLDFRGAEAIADGTKVVVTGGDVAINSYATYSISGKITGSMKSAGIDATLELSDSSGQSLGAPVRSSGDGTYTITSVPAGNDYQIKISRHGYDDFTTPEFDVADNLTNRDYELQRTGYTVTGRITGDAVPLPGARVQLKDFGSANVGAPVTTEADGTYTITGVPPGRMYTIAAYKPGYGNNRTGLTDIFADTAIDLNLTSHFTISGRITPATAALAATVQLKDKDGKAVGEPVQTLAADGSTGGTYTIANVPPGEGYTIEATMAGYTIRATTPFNVVSYNITDKDLTLSKTSP
ncbi:carboxypeptidase regulatory-like domain-containing protein [Candidatus Formimonas warabiya]|uniref:Dockerin domain-containing protein n=1 Tax=Formimonas warabiya TaxID=1761012 RepID=A0A3G1KQK5_FORW1|nr:carboxypeptidase regulatory-like domain-containing protein [Candidatus Formimonas warabiya]ATW24405.1 hypothetical protein DCMF_06065 [Candidatus Formimonas warabiya]